MGIRQFDTITPAAAERSSAHRAGALDPKVTRSTGQDLLAAGIPAPGRPAGSPALVRTLALAGDGRLARAGAALLQLQRHYGNRHVQQVIDGARRRTDRPAAPARQTKLMVGPADDDHEREADRVAEQVTRLPAVRLQREEDTAGVRAGPGPQHPGARAFEAADDVERTMHAVRTSGRPMPAPLQQEFETTFGADFGAVRIHTGDQAVRLSHDLHAQAFTQGSDVFFGAGRYAPGTPAGRRLLAHELTHVVQQGRAPSRGESRGGAAPARSAEHIQRKLSLDNTNWPKATDAWSSEGGGGGVVFVTDEPGVTPLVVKSREAAPAEVLMAANLHRLGGAGVWRRDAPGVRPVGKYEGRVIRKFVIHRIRQGDNKARGLIEDADKPGTLVFEYAGGEDFKDLLKNQTEHSESKLGGRRLRNDSPVRLFKDPGFVAALGRFSAIDIFTGNWDRLPMYNAENFKLDRMNNTILLMDNVYTGGGEFAFKTMATLTSQQAYSSWINRPLTKMLQADDFEGIAKDLLQTVKDGMLLSKDVRQKDLQTVNRALDKGRGWLAQGLQEGKALLSTIAGGNLAQVTQGVAPEDVAEVQASLNKRLAFLFPAAFPERRFAWED
jgi:hypothetical protein